MSLLSRLRSLRTRSAATSPASPSFSPELLPEIKQTGAWWRLLPFTLYRIKLADDLFTAPGDGFDASRDIRIRIVLDLCGGSLADKTIVDLGCNEGGFAVEFARLGAKESVGIEAREVSWLRCELVRKLARLQNLKFVRGDVMVELARWPSSFDVVFASGILYHVTDPHQLLSDIFAACRGAVLIDTHVARREAPSHVCSEEIVSRTFGGKSYQGRLFPEVSDTARESQLWAAWGPNNTSFWLLEDELLTMMRAIGFHEIQKVDPTKYGGDENSWAVDKTNRIMVVGKK